MGLNLLYSPEPSLQEGFLDKSTGLPLSFGLVFFYSDVNRTVLKPIYELSGSPPNYTYTALPNPVILSGIGTIQDGSGNDVIPYFFPYDSAGNVELYYIVVTDQFGVQQFTRQGFPNIGANVNPVNPINFTSNFAPNGQFLLWNPPASYPNTKYTINYGGTIGVTSVIDVAPGGWNFQVPTGSTAVYTFSFNQLLATLFNPSSSPRYEIEIVRSGVSIADPICDLRIRFMDVNKFQSDGTNDTWTLLFNAEAQATLPGVTIHLIKYFGTSGATTTPADVTEDIVWGGPITITTSQQVFAIASTFGDNVGKTIGNNNTDFIELAIRFPAAVSQTFDVKLTDFMLINQNITQAQANSISFPVTTNGEFVLQALSNLAPTTTSNTTTNYYQEDGSNLYLPMVMTQRGYTYDYGELGTIVADTQLSTYTGAVSNITNRLICDGSQYRVTDYSPLGIPYRRLFNRIFNSSIIMPAWGTGATFVNASLYTIATPSFLYLFTNQPGVQTAPANGATSPGFTYPKNVPGFASINFDAWANFNGEVSVRCKLLGAVAAPIDGTGAAIIAVTLTNTFETFFRIDMSVPAAAALSTGLGNPATFITLSTTTTTYSFWFNVAGELANGGGTRIEVQLDITMDKSAVAAILANTINAYQFNLIQLVAGAAIPQSSFFTFHANGVTYSPWFNVNGGGTAPVSPNPIQVNITGTETVTQIGLDLLAAINTIFFAVPDLRGLFIRGYDPNGVYDGQGQDRVSKVYNVVNNSPNTFELDTFTSHSHPALPPATQYLYDGAGVGQFVGGGTFGGFPTTGIFGNYETRPLNESVVWVIKY